jgi:DNA-binding MarR family transcriptional regulator
MSLRKPGHVDELLNYRLGRLVALSGAPIVRLCEGRYGVARREWGLIAQLGASGTASPSILAERCGLDRARTSRTITTLVQKQLARRDASAADPRRALVSLTPAGTRIYEALLDDAAAYHAELVAVLDDAMLDSLDRALHALMGRASELNARVATDVRADRRHGGSRARWPRGSPQ